MARRARRRICSTPEIPACFDSSIRLRRARRRSGPCPEKRRSPRVDHVHFGLSVLNRWAAGEANPWAGADWNASWQRTTVSEDQWRTLRDGLRDEAAKWRKIVASRTNWDDMGAAAALSTAAHTAYHLGAIRQILAGLTR